MPNDTESIKFISSVKVGPKGQIVIPKEVRDLFGIAPGDTLVLLADSARGIAIERHAVLARVADAIFAGKSAPDGTGGADAMAYAQALRAADKKEKTK